MQIAFTEANGCAFNSPSFFPLKRDKLPRPPSERNLTQPKISASPFWLPHYYHLLFQYQCECAYGEAKMATCPKNHHPIQFGVGWLSMFSHPIPGTIERIIIMKMGAAKRVYRETKPYAKRSSFRYRNIIGCWCFFWGNVFVLTYGNQYFNFILKESEDFFY